MTPHAHAASSHEPSLGKQRIEALTDGIFAVAMTLLVIELKLPEPGAIKAQAQLIEAVVHLLPKFIAWVISFFVLAAFWFGHNRLFHHVTGVPPRLIWANMLLLAAVSLMPFSSALVGEFSGAFFAQALYALNMALLALLSLACAVLVFRHGRHGDRPMSAATFRAARWRSIGLLALCLLDLLIAWFVPSLGTVAFAGMAVVGAIARRLERGATAGASTPA
jgi:uncharacterized membrane protein